MTLILFHDFVCAACVACRITFLLRNSILEIYEFAVYVDRVVIESKSCTLRDKQYGQVNSLYIV